MIHDQANIPINPSAVILRQWKPHQNDEKSYLGHISLEIPEKNLYICFSVIKNDHESGGRIISNHLDDRVTLNGRRSDVNIILYGLDIEKIAKEHNRIYEKYLEQLNNNKTLLFWRKCVVAEFPLYIANIELQNDRYEINSSNCCHYAYHLLKIGGIEKLSNQIKVSVCCGKTILGLIETGSIIGLLTVNNIPEENQSGKEAAYIIFGIMSFVGMIGLIFLQFTSLVRNCLGYGTFVTPEGVMRVAHNVPGCEIQESSPEPYVDDHPPPQL